MPYIPAAYGQVTHFLRLEDGGDPSGPVVVTYGIEPVTQSQETLDTCVDYFCSMVQNVLSSAWETYHATLQAGPNGVGPIYENNRAQSGTQGGTALPPAVSALIKKGSGLGGRKNRGRMFLPGFPAASTTNGGTISTLARVAAQTEIDSFFEGIQSEDINMVILHTAETSPTTVTSFELETVLATQRRRQR